MLILADDLTGAADTGATFRSHGRPVRIIGPWDQHRRSLSVPNDLPHDAVLVVDTDTRDATDAVAGDRLRWLADQPVVAAHPSWLFKKIDSLLRGPIAAELRALGAAQASRRIVCAPALPATGRTTVGGQQLVHGEPLGSSRRGDPRSVGSAGDVRHATGLDDAIGIAAGATLADGDVLVDAVTDADLDRIVDQLGDDGHTTLLVGTAGLAAALARHLGPGGTSPAVIGLPDDRDRSAAGQDGQGPPAAGAAGGPALVISLSPSPVARRQVTHLLEQTDAIEIHVDGPESSAGVPAGRAHPPTPGLDEARRRLAACGTVVLTAALADGPPAGEHARAQVLERTVAMLRALTLPPTIVANGGDAARCVLRAVGTDAMDVLAALPDGAVRCRLGGPPHRPTILITKSGSFGSDDALRRALDQPTPTTRPRPQDTP